MKNNQRRCSAHKNKIASIAILIAFLVTGVASAQAIPTVQTHPSTPAVDVTQSTPVSNEPNATCPVTLGEKIDPNQWVDYQGKRVYLCCARCKRKFQNDPQAYVANLPALFKTILSSASSADVQAPAASSDQAAAPADKPHSDHDHDNGDNGGNGNNGEAAHTGSKPNASHGAEPGHDEAHDADHDSDHDSGHDQGEAHDHAAHHHGAGPSFLSRLIGWFGKFHPPVTHFPIALSIAALVSEALFVVTRKPMFDAAARFTVWFAILGTVAGVILGWCFGGFKLSDGDWIMTTHRWLGTAAGLWVLVLAWTACKTWADPPVHAATWRKRFRMALVVAVILISLNGFLGGALIYSLSHYSW